MKGVESGLVSITGNVNLTNRWTCYAEKLWFSGFRGCSPGFQDYKVTIWNSKSFPGFPGFPESMQIWESQKTLILSLRESTTLSGFRHKFRIVQHVTKHVIKRYFRFHINKCSIRASFCASDFLLVFPPTLMADTVFAGYSTTSFRFIFVAPTAITALVCLVSQGSMFLLQCVLAPWSCHYSPLHSALRWRYK